MANIGTILIPTRPQPDTIVAIFLLKKFGADRFGAIKDASVEIRPALAAGETFDTLLAQHILALDIGGGPLDHHGKQGCTTELVARYLGIDKDPSLAQLLAYTKRDDKDGKGTVSRDALDRAFGLSGLIAALNKAYPTEPQYVVDATLPLLEAHWQSAYEHHVELPAEVERKRKTNEYREHIVRQAGRQLKVATVISDKPSMPTYLRSERGGRAEVVVQKSETTNHICILTRQDRGIDLSKVMGLIRLREAELGGQELGDDESYVAQTGRITEVPHWYYDPATNSLLNGGAHNRGIEESRIAWEEMVSLSLAGLELGTTQPESSSPSRNAASYYLSINIPPDVAERITTVLEAADGVKVHDTKNLHITLHHFGTKSTTEAHMIAQAVAEALVGQEPFEMTLHEGLLRAGSPEGYTDTKAWYLAIGEDVAERIHAMREAIFDKLGLPMQTKALHITLAADRNRNKNASENAVRFAQPVEMTIPVNEIVLMESASVGGKRAYRAHSTFPLTQ